jgi:flagellar protein FliS
MYGPQSTANAYRNTAASTGEELSPQRKVALLINGTIEKIRRAQAQIAEGQLAEKLKTIDSVLSIIEVLRASLDFQQGGQIAETLGSLYDTAMMRVVEANANNDIAKLDAVAKMLAPIAEAFAQLAPTPAKPAAGG